MLKEYLINVIWYSVHAYFNLSEISIIFQSHGKCKMNRLLIIKWDNWLLRHEKFAVCKQTSGRYRRFPWRYNLIWTIPLRLHFSRNALFLVSLIQIVGFEVKASEGEIPFCRWSRAHNSVQRLPIPDGATANANVTCFRANYNYQHFHGMARKNRLKTQLQRLQLRPRFQQLRPCNILLNAGSNVIHKCSAVYIWRTKKPFYNICLFSKNALYILSLIANACRKKWNYE